MATKPSETKETARKKNYESFKKYITTSLKKIHPDAGLQGEARMTVDNFVKTMIDRIMSVADLLCRQNGEHTVSSRTIQTAIQLILPEQLRKHAVREAITAVTKYNSSMVTDGEKTVKSEKMSASTKAGVQFPVTRLKEMWMRPRACGRRIGATAPVYLAAVLEYLVTKLLELAGNVATDAGKVRVTNRYILLATQNDAEFRSLTKDMILAGGVVPHIHESLLKKKA